MSLQPICNDLHPPGKKLPGRSRSHKRWSLDTILCILSEPKFTWKGRIGDAGRSFLKLLLRSIIAGWVRRRRFWRLEKEGRNFVRFRFELSVVTRDDSSRCEQCSWEQRTGMENGTWDQNGSEGLRATCARGLELSYLAVPLDDRRISPRRDSYSFRTIKRKKEVVSYWDFVPSFLMFCFIVDFGCCWEPAEISSYSVG